MKSTTKKLTCLLLLLAMLLPVIPVYAEDELRGEGHLSGMYPEEKHNRLVSLLHSGPELAKGNHEKWIDRVGNLPDYAKTFYTWLEQNANPKGALVDPTMGEFLGGGYCHTVVTETGSVQGECSRTDYIEKAEELVSEAMYEIFTQTTPYVGAVYDAFDRDHPEIFWLNGSGLYGYTGSYYYGYRNGVVTATFEIYILFYLQAPGFDVRYDRYTTAGTVAQDITRRDEAVAKILSQCPQSDKKEQVLYLNRVLTETNAYNSASAVGQNDSADIMAWECLSALTGNVGTKGPVCEGYAKAFMILCKKLGLPCVLVDGFARTELSQPFSGHMWNNVCIDGSWYAVDVTWDDPYYTRNPTQAQSGQENQKWILLGADSMVTSDMTYSQSHLMENRVGNDGLAFSNGPLLSKTEYTPGAQTASITGTITCYGDGAQELTMTLYRPGETLPLLVQTYLGGRNPFSFQNIKAGTYLLRLSKPLHTPREYEISTQEAIDLDLKLCLQGDVTGDGKINVGDVARIYSHARKNKLLTDYPFSCADMNGDGKVNIGDAARAYGKVKA